MSVFATASTIGQAFKNVGRVTEIVTIFGKHGFLDLLQRMQMTRFLRSKEKENPRFAALPFPQRLRLSFEEAGPTFVKLGQLLATRSDLLPEALTEELAKLQDNVGAVEFSEIRKLVESELGQPLSSVFTEFDETPIAAASIAQVHGAKLISGERVAVKVQRPGIERLIQNDVSILRGLAQLLEKYVAESRPFNPIGLVEEFFKTILMELDFLIEANNIRRIRTNLEPMQQVSIPQVYSALSTSRVLVLERFDGIRFSDREAIIAAGMDPKKIIETGSDVFFHMVMHDGLFHGDLHAGNLFALPHERIGIIDFGIVGRLSRRVQDSIISMFLALVDEDYETLAHEYAYLCQGSCDLQRLQKDLMDTISPYIGMSLGEVNVGKVLLRSTSIAVRHHLQVPRELMLLFKAMVTVEAIGKRLDPDFDLMRVGTRLARQVISTRYNKDRIVRDLILMGRDTQALAETLPKLVRRAVRTWSQNNFAFEWTSPDVRALNRSVATLSYAWITSMFGASLFALGIALVLRNEPPFVLGIPLLGIGAIGCGTLAFLRCGWTIRKRIR